VSRKTGYLANINNVPPLIFRFQFNPDILRERKSFKYNPVNDFGKWDFDQTAAASGVFGTLGGLSNDFKEIGSLLAATRPLQPDEGEPDQFIIDFALDASRPGPIDGADHYGGSVEPDLAVLRSFMLPAWGVVDVGKWAATGFSIKDIPCWNRPPECDLVYGGISVTCVMTDLDIKITAFHDDGTPQRADVSVTLKQQSFAFSPMTELLTRNINVLKSFNRPGFGTDVLAVTPVTNLFV